MSIILLILIIVLSGCNQSGDKSHSYQACEVIEIGKAFDKKSKVPLGEYACAIDYIPLETAPECMLDGANSLDIRVSGDRIYLYNSNYFLDKAKSLPLLFGSDGSFITSIGSIGNSSDEFITIKNIMIF